MSNEVHFQYVSVSDIEVESIHMLDSKASKDSFIPLKLIKGNTYAFTPIFSLQIISLIELTKFPHSMKVSKITSLYKKDNRANRINYRPICIWPNLTKVFESCNASSCIPLFIRYWVKRNTNLGRNVELNKPFSAQLSRDKFSKND